MPELAAKESTRHHALERQSLDSIPPDVEMPELLASGEIRHALVVAGLAMLGITAK